MPRHRNGFSLLEVLVALMVAATLSLGLMSAQSSIIHLADRSAGIWANLNFATTMLAEDYPARLRMATSGFADRDGNRDTQWKLDRVGELDGLGHYMLTTKVPASSIEWEWLRDETRVGATR
ncbi:prepilin-type N-terminal cleavage/methylation domain-containing protein [Desulfobaculum xiamenense]|uniref:Prepilin-type N-terminal cleavage/methylation domain-containing protein n=1 Tax=Desulfobaculum xiamenense TaxID=995050 RepID=A0A846QKJ0_9BACT|nr:prepilin-type N-terminal cleavage/methylation domain-containing protein [Desulfobaculum xiamenense]NJB68651.1 prepilin-type N-terminal cleavage/methylation domain-containing protein [Desulfobaculum xiamenense]